MAGSGSSQATSDSDGLPHSCDIRAACQDWFIYHLRLRCMKESWCGRWLNDRRQTACVIRVSMGQRLFYGLTQIFMAKWLKEQCVYTSGCLAKIIVFLHKSRGHDDGLIGYQLSNMGNELIT